MIQNQTKSFKRICNNVIKHKIISMLKITPTIIFLNPIYWLKIQRTHHWKPIVKSYKKKKF